MKIGTRRRNNPEVSFRGQTLAITARGEVTSQRAAARRFFNEALECTALVLPLDG